MTHNITRMTDAELDRAAQALTNAFMEDPLQKYTFPYEADRKTKSPAHFAAALRYGLMFGEVFTDEKGAGASIWLKPGGTDFSDERTRAAGFSELPDKMGADPFERFFSALGFAEEFHKKDAPEPHWYTMVVGVDPSFQGQGFGRALLDPVLNRAKNDKFPVYLETAQPKNVTFYEKLGFDVVRELVEPTSGLKMWTFLKEP